MIVRKTDVGFSLHHSQCEGMGENCRCKTCVAGRKGLVANVKFFIQPKDVPVGPSTQIDHIENDPV